MTGESAFENEELRMEFNERYNSVISKLKLTSFKHVSDITGIRADYIKRINSNNQVLSTQNLAKFCNTFTVNIDYMFGVSDKMFNDSKIIYTLDNTVIRASMLNKLKENNEDIDIGVLAKKYNTSRSVVRDLLRVSNSAIRMYKLLRLCNMIGIKPSDVLYSYEDKQNITDKYIRLYDDMGLHNRRSISARIKHIMRANRNMTANELSEKSGISIDVISNILNCENVNDPTIYHLSTLIRIAETLDANVSYLVCRCYVHKEKPEKERFKRWRFNAGSSKYKG